MFHGINCLQYFCARFGLTHVDYRSAGKASEAICVKLGITARTVATRYSWTRLPSIETQVFDSGHQRTYALKTSAMTGLKICWCLKLVYIHLALLMRCSYTENRDLMHIAMLGLDSADRSAQNTYA